MTSVPRKASRSRLPFLAGVFVAFICVTILGLSGWRGWVAREGELKNAEVDMANLARSLTQHAEDSLDLLDASILGVVSRLQTDGVGPSSVSTIQKILDLRKAGLQRISSLSVYDESGRWPASLEQPNRFSPDISDRAYFLHHQHSADSGAFVGPPVKSRTSGEWSITLSRRFNHPDGSFAGVVLGSISSRYFAQFYQQFEIGSHGAIVLVSADGILLSRSLDFENSVGTDLSNAPLYREPLSHSRAGTYYFKSPLDGLQRLSFFKRSDRFPIVVLATMEEDEVLAPWWEKFITRMALVVVLTSLIAIIGGFLVRQLHLAQHFTTTLAAKEADFRLLAEESSDMVTRIGPDERIQYVSPSCERIVGWRPEQLIGTPALAGVNAEDLPMVNDTVAALKRGDITEVRIVYRTRHRDALEVWIESAMRVTRNSITGEIDGVVAISRDVTERKIAEARFAALAVLDGLTGLANRRRFDERLQEEWARAFRDGTSISLLMIDVDHFKTFNDQYGHPAGDACLRMVAKVLAAEARRPADLAARYGGEEFVLLLPNTDAAGCELVGARILEELRKLCMAHAVNAPSRQVTLSLGGASVRPNAQGLTESTSLIQTADQALYAAKDAGRDRLIMSEPAATRPAFA
jgi:diguanylate cyclase (GGDEF)-like protein/PAS domain S-box-containing protein